jgi:hypothetical protein
MYLYLKLQQPDRSRQIVAKAAEEGTIFERLHREAMQRELKREVVLLSSCFLVDSYVVSWLFFQLLLGLSV